MKNLKYIFFLIFILPLIISSCQTTGGVWLKEGERKGKAYKFGGQKMTDNLLELAEKYDKAFGDYKITKEFIASRLGAGSGILGVYALASED